MNTLFATVGFCMFGILLIYFGAYGLFLIALRNQDKLENHLEEEIKTWKEENNE